MILSRSNIQPRWSLLCAALFAYALLLFPETAFAAIDEYRGFLTQEFINRFIEAVEGYREPIQEAALTLFISLATIQIVLTGLRLLFDTSDLSFWFGVLVRDILLLTVFWFILSVFVLGFPTVGDSKSIIEILIDGLRLKDFNGVRGSDGLIVEEPLLLGFNMVSNFVQTLEGGLGDGAEFGLTIAVIIIMALFAWITAVLLIAVVDLFLTVNVGILLLMFGGTRFTLDIAYGYFRHVFAVAVRLLLLQIIIVFGIDFLLALNEEAFDSTTDFATLETALIVIAEVLIFALVISQVPNRLAGIISGSRFGSLGFAGTVGSSQVLTNQLNSSWPPILNAPYAYARPESAVQFALSNIRPPVPAALMNIAGQNANISQQPLSPNTEGLSAAFSEMSARNKVTVSEGGQSTRAERPPLRSHEDSRRPIEHLTDATSSLSDGQAQRSLQQYITTSNLDQLQPNQERVINANDRRASERQENFADRERRGAPQTPAGAGYTASNIASQLRQQEAAQSPTSDVNQERNQAQQSTAQAQAPQQAQQQSGEQAAPRGQEPPASKRDSDSQQTSGVQPQTGGEQVPSRSSSDELPPVQPPPRQQDSTSGDTSSAQPALPAEPPTADTPGIENVPEQEQPATFDHDPGTSSIVDSAMGSFDDSDDSSKQTFKPFFKLPNTDADTMKVDNEQDEITPDWLELDDNDNDNDDDKDDKDDKE